MGRKTQDAKTAKKVAKLLLQTEEDRKRDADLKFWLEYEKLRKESEEKARPIRLQESMEKTFPSLEYFVKYNARLRKPRKGNA